MTTHNIDKSNFDIVSVQYEDGTDRTEQGYHLFVHMKGETVGKEKGLREFVIPYYTLREDWLTPYEDTDTRPESNHHTFQHKVTR